MKKLSMLLCAFALIGCEEKESAKNIVAERKLDALGNAEFKDDVVTDSQDSRIVGYWAMDVTKALAAYDNLPESYESSAAERSEISQSSLGDGPIYHFKENGEVRMYFGSRVNLATYELHAEEGSDTTVVIETEGEGAESMTLSAKDDSLRMILPEEAPPLAGIFALSRVPFAKVAKDIAKVEENAAYWDNLRAERQAERVSFDGYWVPDLEATETTLKRRKPSQQKERPTEEVMRALQEDFQRNPTTVFFDSDNILKIYDKNGEDKMTYGTVEYALGLGNEVHITIDGDWVFTMEDSQLVWNNRYWSITGFAAGVVMKRITDVEAKRRIPEGAQSSEEEIQKER